MSSRHGDLHLATVANRVSNRCYNQATFVSRGFHVLVLCALAWSAALFAQKTSQRAEPPAANFVDVAGKAGLAGKITFGGEDRKRYIIETTGTGVALLDFDGDGWVDIFIVNGTATDATAGKGGSSFLYRNNHNGTFTNVARVLSPL